MELTTGTVGELLPEVTDLNKGLATTDMSKRSTVFYSGGHFKGKVFKISIGNWTKIKFNITSVAYNEFYSIDIYLGRGGNVSDFYSFISKVNSNTSIDKYFKFYRKETDFFMQSQSSMSSNSSLFLTYLTTNKTELTEVSDFNPDDCTLITVQ